MNGDSEYEDAQSKVDNEEGNGEIKQQLHSKTIEKDIDKYEVAQGDDDIGKVKAFKGENKIENGLSLSSDTAFENTTIKGGCCKGSQKKCVIF